MKTKLSLIGLLILTLFFSNCSAQNYFLDQGELDLLTEGSRTSRSDAFIIYENDKLLVEEYGSNGHRDSLIQPWSCTKSIVSLAFIALLDDGIIDSLEMPVYKIYPEWNQGQKKYITIKHLLMMSSGLQCAPRLHAEVYPSSDCIKLALSASVIETPGTTWRYNNKGFGLLADIVRKLTGKALNDYMKVRIFEPLGITKVDWDGDKNGTPYAFMGGYLRPLDFAKIGLLVLNGGNFEGKQVLSNSNLSKIIQTADIKDNYGLGWWISYYPKSDSHSTKSKIRGIIAGGSYGNKIIILPDHNIVAIRLISYKTYGNSEEQYDTTEDQNGPSAYPNLESMLHDLVN